MRVLLISDHADPLARPGTGFKGGQNVYVRGLATALAGLGCTVDVVTRRDSPALPARETIAPRATVFRIEAGPAKPIPRHRFGQVLGEFSDAVDSLYERNGGYDVVHSHYWYSGQTALHLADQRHVPVVHTFHSIGTIRRAARVHAGRSIDMDPYEERCAAEQRIALAADALVVSCPREMHDLSELLAAPQDKVHLVPPGVDRSVVRPIPQHEARALVGIDPDVPVVLFVGRLEDRKGCAELAAAFADLRERRPRARLIIVGGLEASRDLGGDVLPALIHRHGLSSSVELRGPVPHHETHLYYSAADVTAVPSHYEPFGLVAIESMACGTPVVATRVGGLEWTVCESVGALVPVHDRPALASALDDVISAGRDHFTQSCTDRVSTMFTTETWARGVLAVYRKTSHKNQIKTETRAAS